MSLLQDHAPSPPQLAVTCLLPDPLGFLPNHGVGGLLPTSVSAAPSAQPIPAQQSPTLYEQEPVAKGGRQARGQVRLALGPVTGMLASDAAKEEARLLRVSV